MSRTNNTSFIVVLFEIIRGVHSSEVTNVATDCLGDGTRTGSACNM